MAILGFELIAPLDSVSFLLLLAAAIQVIGPGFESGKEGYVERFFLESKFYRYPPGKPF